MYLLYIVARGDSEPGWGWPLHARQFVSWFPVESQPRPSQSIHPSAALVSPCTSHSFFGPSCSRMLCWCSEAIQPGMDSPRTRTTGYPHLGHFYSLPSTFLPERGPMTRLPLWFCIPELGPNHSHLPMSRTRFILHLGRAPQFSFPLPAPASNGSEIREFDTGLRMFTSMVCSFGLWIPGTTFRGGSSDSSGSMASLLGDTTSRSLTVGSGGLVPEATSSM